MILMTIENLKFSESLNIMKLVSTLNWMENSDSISINLL